MRSTAFKIETIHWPYGIEVQAVEGGLLLRPRKKARTGWDKLFKGAETKDLSEFRAIRNQFDDKEWEW